MNLKICMKGKKNCFAIKMEWVNNNVKHPVFQHNKSW